MVREEQIKDIAHAIWEQEGCPDGKDLEHYFRAKRILEEQEASQVIKKEAPSRVESAQSQQGKRRSRKKG